MESEEQLSNLRRSQTRALLNSLSILIEQEEHIDLELRCGGKSIFCHKMIMSLSPLLYLCLKDTNDETATVILPDFEYHEVNTLVQNIYNSLSLESMEDFKCDRDLASEFLLTNLVKDPMKKRVKCEIFPIKQENVTNGDINENLQEAFMEMTEEWVVKVEGNVEHADSDMADNEDASGTVQNEEVAEKYFISGKRAKMGLRNLKRYPKFDDKLPRLPWAGKWRKKPFSEEAAKMAGKKLIQCTRCEFQTHNQTIFRQHNKTAHQKIGPASCIKCHNSYDSRNMWRHQQICLKSTVCEDCGFVSSCQQEFYYHRRYQHTMFKCKLCNEMFEGKAKLSAHNTIKHRGSIPCSTCGKIYPNSSCLASHMKRVHTPNEEKRFKCQYCGKGYTDKTKLLSHEAYAHSRDKPFRCRFDCGKAFNDYGNRIKHEKIHKK